MKCLHKVDVFERKVLGVSIYYHKDKTYCTSMNSKVSLKELEKEFVLENDREKFAFIDSDKVQEEIIENLKEKNVAKLIVYMKRHKIFLEYLFELLLSVFGRNFYGNIKELNLFDIDKEINESKNRMQLENFSVSDREEEMVKVFVESLGDLF